MSDNDEVLSEIFDRDEKRKRLFKAFPELEHLAEEGIDRLRVRRFREDEVLYEEKERHSLFLVLSGTVYLWNKATGNIRMIAGRGMVIGDDAVIAQAVEEGILPPEAAAEEPARFPRLSGLLPRLTRHDGPPRGPEEEAGFVAEAVDTTLVLELPRESFREAFWPDGKEVSAFFKPLLGAYRVNQLAHKLVQSLAATPELGNARTQDFFRLLRGAELMDLASGTKLDTRGHRPERAFLVVEGTLEAVFSQAGDITAQFTRGSAVCLREMILGTAPAFDLRAGASGARVVCIQDRTFTQLMLTEPDFQRAIVRTLGSEVMTRLGEDGHSEDVLLLLIEEHLATTHASLARALPGLTDLLAERLAVGLCDWVLVLHLQPSHVERRVVYREFSPRPLGFNPDDDFADTEKTWVEYRDIPIPPGLGSIADLIEQERQQGCGASLRRANVTLVDVSALIGTRDGERGENGSPWRWDDPRFELASSPHHRLVFLVDTPERTEAPLQLMATTPVIHTAVLRGEDALRVAAGKLLESARKSEDSALRKLKRLLGDVRELRRAARATLEPASDWVTSSLKRSAQASSWPLRTVRTRFAEEFLVQVVERHTPGGPPLRFEVLHLEARLEKATLATLDRWARGITYRRIGLALGGGGTFGNIHIPLIERLGESNIPVDLISGASAGSTMGAYYIAAGPDWKEKLDRGFERLTVASALSFISTAFLEWTLMRDLGLAQLESTEISFIPVVTDADTGIEWDVRQGTVARGVRASASLPPLGPTVIGDRRFLDGGLVANVPINVLREEGAGFVLASNPIASVKARPRRSPWPIPLGRALLELNPLLRLEDIGRMVPMIFRTAGTAQSVNADVVYMPRAGDSSLLSRPTERFIERAEETPALNQAVAEFQQRFRVLLRHAPSLVHLDEAEPGHPTPIVVHGLIHFEPGSATLHPSSHPALDALVAFLDAHPELTKVRVQCRSTNLQQAEACAKTIGAHLCSRKVAADRLELLGTGPDGQDTPEEAREVVVEFYAMAQAKSAEHDLLLRQTQEAREAQRLAERSALARGLVLGAAWEAVRGDLELGRLLALEAAALDSSPATDQVLRMVLGRRGLVAQTWSVPDAVNPAVSHAAFAPGGGLLAMGSSDGFVRVWDVLEGTGEPRALLDHRGGSHHAVMGVAWSDDGRFLATAGMDGSLQVHEVSAAGTVSRSLRASVGTWDQWGVAFAPGGARLLATAPDARGRTTLGLWSWAGGSLECEARLEHAASVSSAAWSPDGTRVVVTTAKDLHLWSVAEGAAPKAELLPVRGTVAAVAWRSDGRRFAVATGPGARVHDADTRETVLEVTGHERQVLDVRWSPDGTRLLTAGEDGTARVWDAETGAFMMLMRAEEGIVTGAAWHPEGQFLATWGHGRHATVWHAATGRPVSHLIGHKGTLRQAVWRPGQPGQLATASADGTVRLWEVHKSSQTTFEEHRASVWMAERCPTREREVSLTAGRDGSVFLWQSSTGAPLRALLTSAGVESPTRTWAAWSPKGDAVAVVRAGQSRPQLFTSDGAPGPELEPVTGEDPGFRQLVFSPEGGLLAAQGQRQVAIWEVGGASPGRLLGRLQGKEDIHSIAWDPRPESHALAVARWRAGDSVVVVDGRSPDRQLDTLTLDFDGLHGDGVWFVAYSPDGKRLATASNDNFLRIFDTATWKLLGRLDHEVPVKTLAWHPDGSWLATADNSYAARLWDVRDLDNPRKVMVDLHPEGLRRLAWSPDGRYLAAAAGADVRLWRLADSRGPERVAILAGQDGEVVWLAFSPDGTELVVAGEEGAVRVHPTRFETLVECVRQMPGRNEMTPDEWLRYMGAQQPRRPTWAPFPASVGSLTPSTAAAEGKSAA